MVKTKLTKDIKGEDFTPVQREFDGLELIMTDELAENIEKKLISLSDIRETIWYAESTGDRIIDEFGMLRCCLQKPVLTYWVTCKKTGGAYEVLEAYSHRMRFGSEDA